MQKKIQQSTSLAGIIGWPISHSSSPKIHNYWLSTYGLDGVYLPFAVNPKNFKKAIHSLFSLGIVGVNITIPFKEIALYEMDELDTTAKEIGAVNTVVVKNNGCLLGKNTDGEGFLENLREKYPTWQPSERPSVVLGAGGAARSIVFALKNAGVKEIRVVNRTIEKAENLASSVGKNCVAIDWKNSKKIFEDVNLLVNATSLGMKENPWDEFSIESLPTDAVVNDIVYKPIDTDLLIKARNRGNKIVDGLGMLLHQAVPAFNEWFGIVPKIDNNLRKILLSE